MNEFVSTTDSSLCEFAKRQLTETRAQAYPLPILLVTVTVCNERVMYVYVRMQASIKQTTTVSLWMHVIYTPTECQLFV